MNETPHIVRSNISGRCWQVELWPEDESGIVVLKRGGLIFSIPMDTFRETCTVIC
jgi:hypothetical protein